MARKDDGLTPRQRQSREIMRDKAAKKKRKVLLRRTFIVGGTLAAAVSLGGGLWLWKSGVAVRSVNAAVEHVYGMTAKGGFAVQALYLEGRNRTSMTEIDKALDIKKGDPILEVSLSDMRERLEKIESVKFAAVERALPGTIYVRIVEREPVALWQHQGKLALVDDNGVVMNGLDIAPYQHLPLIIGDDAPKHVRDLMALLGTEPELAKRFSSAIYVSDRRWNIRLNSGAEGSAGSNVEVRLPESNPVDAWKKLAELQQHNQVLDRDVKVIDLRLEGKMFIKLAPVDSVSKTANARET